MSSDTTVTPPCTPRFDSSTPWSRRSFDSFTDNGRADICHLGECLDRGQSIPRTQQSRANSKGDLVYYLFMARAAEM